MMPNATTATIGDVIQLDPEHSHGWGPLLCIVDDVRTWGVVCYAMVPEKRDTPPATMPMRVNHGCYWVIGPAVFRLADSSEVPTDGA